MKPWTAWADGHTRCAAATRCQIGTGMWFLAPIHRQFSRHAACLSGKGSEPQIREVLHAVIGGTSPIARYMMGRWRRSRTCLADDPS
jgi:hypothetical protein